MIATVSTYKPLRSVILVPYSIALLLLVSPVLITHQFIILHRNSVTGEYQSGRGLILTSIATAVERQDFETLRKINEKYTRYVSDGTFRSAIQQALAKVAAHEAALELTVSKHLDLLRNQEEAPNWPVPQVAKDSEVAGQTLSKLPR